MRLASSAIRDMTRGELMKGQFVDLGENLTISESKVLE